MTSTTDLIEMAQAYCRDNAGRTMDGHPLPLVQGLLDEITRLQARRDEVLEEAARVADEEARVMEASRVTEPDADTRACYLWSRQTAESIARKLRTLSKSTPAPPAEDDAGKQLVDPSDE